MWQNSTLIYDRNSQKKKEWGEFNQLDKRVTILLNLKNTI